MGKINLLITNASAEFSKDDIELIRRATKASEKFISDNFIFDYEVDLIIVSPSYLMYAIPEDGISGRTYRSNLIIVVIDKSEVKVTEEMVFETICHEMSHSLRWEKLPEHANTMFEGFILEGLAIALEEKAIADSGKGSSQFFLKEMKRTDKSMVKSMIQNLKDNFDDEEYDYEQIFYAGNDRIPRWAGYRLGYHFVQEYLKRTNATIAEATLASYKDFKANRN